MRCVALAWSIRRDKWKNAQGRARGDGDRDPALLLARQAFEPISQFVFRRNFQRVVFAFVGQKRGIIYMTPLLWGRVIFLEK